MNPLDRTCDAFLDDRMSPGERARFEMRLLREPRLGAVVDLHREVDMSVRRSFAVPDLSRLIGQIEAAAVQMRARGGGAVEGTIRWAAAFASLLFMCLALCASALIPSAAGSVGVEGPSARGIGSTFVQVVSLSLATASAVVASGVQLRRKGKSQSLPCRFASPTGTAPRQTDPVARIAVARDRDPRPDRSPEHENVPPGVRHRVERFVPLCA